MTILRQALTLTPWRLLLFIGRQRGLSLSSKISKADLVERLSAHLPDPLALETCLAGLPLEERQALAGLLTAGGSVPLRYLQPFYGSLRPFRQLPAHYPAQTIPAATAAGIPPLSPLERLRALGLIFHHRPTQEIFIPTDLIPLLQNILGQAGEAKTRGGEDAKKENLLASSPHVSSPHISSPPRPPFPSVDLLCHDLTCLLALLQTADVRPWHGRWLPPTLLRQWGQCCAVSPTSPAARSELQTNRRRFIHYLAENAGWIGGQGSGIGGQRLGVRGQKSPISHLPPPISHLPPPISNLPSPISHLSPTPAAWLWLQAGREARLRQLWQTWNAPQAELWQAYRLPGYEWLADPARLLAPLHQALVELNLTDPTHFARTLLMRTPALLELVPANLLDPITTLVETVEQLLTGPLVWLGVLLKDEGETPVNYRGQVMKAEEFYLSAFILHPSSFTHPLPPMPLPYTKFRLQSNLQPDPLDSTFTLTLENGLPEPLDLMVAMEVGSREYEVGSKGVSSALLPTPYSLLLTAASFISALHRGWSPPALLDALNRLIERPLTPQEITHFHVWADLAEQVTIRPATLLETSDPAIITRLASTRRGRTLIRQTLSPRVIVIDPARLDQVVRRLTEQEGVPPKAEGGRRKDEGSIISSFRLHPSSFLWLTCRVYQELGRFLRLPVRLPQTLLDQVADLVDSVNLSAAESAAAQVLAELQQVIEGRAVFPAWPEAGLPLEETVPLIQTALASAQNLALLYYTAGTDRLTRRVVEPYRLEWRGGAAGEQRRWGAGEKEGQSEIVNLKSEIVNPPEARKAKSKIPYLVGFCHTAQAERVFRLDRIQEITLVPRPNQDGQLWGD